MHADGGGLNNSYLGLRTPPLPAPHSIGAYTALLTDLAERGLLDNTWSPS